MDGSAIWRVQFNQEFFGGKKNWRKTLFDSSRLSSKYKLECLTCGLYYEPTTIVNDDSRVVNKFEASLTDDARVIIYDRYMFIVQATGQVFPGKLSQCQQSGVGNGGICICINYLVLNEMKRYKQRSNTKDFRLVNYSFDTGYIRSKIGQIVTEFYRIF